MLNIFCKDGGFSISNPHLFQPLKKTIWNGSHNPIRKGDDSTITIDHVSVDPSSDDPNKYMGGGASLSPRGPVKRHLVQGGKG